MVRKLPLYLLIYLCSRCQEILLISTREGDIQ